MFGLGANTLRDWEKLEVETGSLENRPLVRGAYKIDREKLLEYYRENPYSTNNEAASCLIAVYPESEVRKKY
jgi:hypothetical protein